MSVAALTHLGAQRSPSEDCFGIGDLGGSLAAPQRSLPDRAGDVASLTLTSGFALGVYDGMGGVAPGELASREAACVTQSTLAEAPRRAPRTSCVTASRTPSPRRTAPIFEVGQRDRRRLGAGTTATVASSQCPSSSRRPAAAAPTSSAIAASRRSRAAIGSPQRWCGRPHRPHRGSARRAAHEHHSPRPSACAGNTEPSLFRFVPCRDDVLLLCADGLSGDGRRRNDQRRAPPPARADRRLPGALRRGDGRRRHRQHHRHRRALHGGGLKPSTEAER